MSASIMLAAGRSQRFGRADKLLQPINGLPLLVRSVGELLHLKSGPIVLVLGRCPRRQIRVLAEHGLLESRLLICRNAHPERGMSYSLQIGLHALPCCVSVLDIHLADMPAFNRTLYDRLRQAYRQGAASGVCVARPFYGARPGHPVRMARYLVDGRVSRDGDDIQQVIRSQPAAWTRAVAGPRSCVADMDTRQMRRTLIWQVRGRTHSPSLNVNAIKAL